MTSKKTSSILLTVAVIIIILGILTLIPSPAASKPCLLGYKAKCSFSPISTLILFLIAGMLFAVRSGLRKKIKAE